MPGMKSRIGFLRYVAGLVGVYGVFGTLRLALYELVYGIRFGFETLGMVSGDALAIDRNLQAHARPYLPTPFYFACHAFRYLPADVSDSVFVEMGCGLGRVMLYASGFPFRKLIGIEVSEPLAAAARRNLERFYRKRRQRSPPWQVVCCDAAAFDVPVESAVFYFADPFDDTVMAPVIDNIVATVVNARRRAFVIYVHPAHPEVLTDRGFRLVASEIDMNNRGFSIFTQGGEDDATANSECNR